MTDEVAMIDRELDSEIGAMATISETFGALEPEQIRRVLKWANERYQARAVPPAVPEAGGLFDAASSPYSEFPEFFDAANPETSVEKVLVAGYWFQVLQKHAELDSQQLNSALKNLGHPSSNITRDLDGLINRSPRLVMQVRKEGSTKQARRRYKLTIEGTRYVERMITRSQNNGNGGESK